MRTPAGQECPHYYADFHRSHRRQECRLLGRHPGPRWEPSDCRLCPVPRLLLANACPHLRLEAVLHPGVIGLGRRIEVRAHCERSGTAVAEPEIGCGHCHEVFSPRLAADDGR